MANKLIHQLNVYRGDDYHWIFKLWSDQQKTQPVDLTDVRVRAEIRDQSQGKNIIPLTCTVDLPNTINMILLATDSINIPRPNAAWDLRLMYVNGNRRTILGGPVIVIPDITDSTPVVAPP
jgi:hypothetical protein